MPSNPISYVPHFQRYSSKHDDDEEAVVQKLTDTEDINKVLDKTDKDNPAGCVTRCTKDGRAVYNDKNHQIVFSPDGTIVVQDRKSMGAQNVKVNFIVKDGCITFHNPDPNAEDPYTTIEIPDGGMELDLGNGTTMLLAKNDDGTIDAQIVNLSGPPPVGGTAVDTTSGTVFNYTGVGNGRKFLPAEFSDGATTGGLQAKSDWERLHPRGTDNNHSGKNGDATRVIVASMYSTGTWQDGRRTSGSGGSVDPGQAAGGFSVISDKRYDINNGAGKTNRYIWHDVTDASNFDNVSKVVNTPDDVRELIERGDAGAQAFTNQNAGEGAPEALYGDGEVYSDEDDDTTADSSDSSGDLSEDSSGGHASGSSLSSGSSVSLAEFLSSGGLLDDRDAERRRQNNS